jgi:hypothetical protein
MNDEQPHRKETGTRMVIVGNVHIVDRINHPTKARIDAMAKSLSGPLGQMQRIPTPVRRATMAVVG